MVYLINLTHEHYFDYDSQVQRINVKQLVVFPEEMGARNTNKSVLSLAQH
jgi:hypothetical protein